MLSACKHLRTKRLFIPEMASDAFGISEQADAVMQCWCNKTMKEIGLDERHVNLKACSDPDRPCHREY